MSHEDDAHESAVIPEVCEELKGRIEMSDKKFWPDSFPESWRTGYVDNGSPRYRCPECDYVKQAGANPRTYIVCCGCLKPIYVNDDLSFTVVKLADVPMEFREFIMLMSGEGM